MKIIAILTVTLALSQSSYAARTCEDYIDDQWPDSRYTVAGVSGDNVVTDNITGLMWKQCSEGLSGSDCMTGTTTVHTWQQALAIPVVLNATGFAGFADWRVPNIEELRSIAAINCFNPAINETVFPNTPSNWFWSSSPIAGYDNGAWIVGFDYGYGYDNGREDFGRVRLVRSGQ